MTTQQDTAIAHPTLLAEECAHPRFGKRSPIGTVVVTSTDRART
jgi:hypothetical protein